LIELFVLLKTTGGLGGSPNFPRNPINELGNYPGAYPGGVASGPGYGSGAGWFAGSNGHVRPGITSINSTYSRDHVFICPAHFRVPKGLDYVVRVGGKGRQQSLLYFFFVFSYI
jgi:hypothetical protein